VAVAQEQIVIEPAATAYVVVYDGANALAVAQVLNVPAVRGAPLNGLPLIPGYAQIALDNIVTPASTGPLRVVLESETAGALYWAFASVTSNSARRVTIITP